MVNIGANDGAKSEKTLCINTIVCVTRLQKAMHEEQIIT